MTGWSRRSPAYPPTHPPARRMPNGAPSPSCLSSNHPPPPSPPAAAAAALNSEQKALLDFLVLARAQRFAGFGSSTFSFYLREYRALHVRRCHCCRRRCPAATAAGLRSG